MAGPYFGTCQKCLTKEVELFSTQRYGWVCESCRDKLREQEFVDAVMRRIRAIMEATGADMADEPMIRSDVPRLFNKGYTVDDAVALLKNTEEVNPTLPEDFALRRMKIITDKYPGGH